MKKILLKCLVLGGIKLRLTRDFYAKDARVLAKELLGKVLVREIDGIKLKGK